MGVYVALKQSFDGASTGLEVTSPIGTRAPPRDAVFMQIKLSYDNKSDGPSPLLSEKCGVHEFKISNFDLCDHRTVFHFTVVHQVLWSREDSCFTGLCSHMVSSSHDGALICICGWHLCSYNDF